MPADDDALDRYLAALPDRLTHAAMLMLGSGLDHTMPGVAYGMDVDARELPELPELGARVFVPTDTSAGRWAVSLNPGFGPRAAEHHWRPLIAAIAQLSGTTIVDLPAPQRDRDVAAVLDVVAKQRPATTAIIATQHEAPDEIALVSAAALVEPSPDYSAAAIGHPGTCGIIATPEEYRRIVRDIADRLRA